MSRLLSLIGASTISLAALVFLLIVVAHVALRWWVRRQQRRPAPPDTQAGDNLRLHHWIVRGLTGTVPAIALLIWIHGLYVVLTLLLPRVIEPGNLDRALVVLRWSYGLSVIAALFWLLLRVGRLTEAFLTSTAARAQTQWDDLVLPMAGRAVRLTLPLLAIILGAPALSNSPAVAEVVRNLSSILLIGVVAVVLFQLVNAGAELILRQHRTDGIDNQRARAIQTQVMVLKRVVVTIIGVFTLASMLMVFDSVRQFGASILASAGIAGIVLGFAAQRSIATLLAGFQVALTQPFRIDDSVVVENESGTVEDITLTYVVVRLWDQRRLVVPMNYFIERPFQNHTRTSTEMIGTVYLRVDYTVPVEALRAELSRILAASPFWDGAVSALHVSEARDHTLELRVIASARNGGQSWELRCEIREKMIAFLQQHYPESLPRVRAVLVDGRGDADARTESNSE
jgi:small-conductance mechanosensitive channel